MEIRTAELGELQALMKKELVGLYPAEELNAIVRSLFSHLTGLTASEMVLEKDRKMSESEIHYLQRSLKRLKKFEPLQYITAVAWFHGLEFKVNPAVLIPRPETEELVEWILKDLNSADGTIKILDIGTGSGCIAISLKKKLPKAEVHAIDISQEALSVAEENADRLDAEVRFRRADILDTEARSALPRYDVIVSNPPYVTPADRKKMMRNVTDHEPSLALFVGEDDPLLFYREIIMFSAHHLEKGGRLYLECNEGNATDVAVLLNLNGFADVELRKDMQGKLRMVLGVPPSPGLRWTK